VGRGLSAEKALAGLPAAFPILKLPEFGEADLRELELFLWRRGLSQALVVSAVEPCAGLTSMLRKKTKTRLFLKENLT